MSSHSLSGSAATPISGSAAKPVSHMKSDPNSDPNDATSEKTSNRQTQFSKPHTHLAAVPAPVQNQPLSEDRLLESLLYTVTTAFLGGAGMQVRQVTAPRESGDLQPGPQVFNYGFREGKPGLPLVFFIPGFGCPYHDDTVSYLAEILHSRGFHVVTVHSPAHPDFLMNAHYSGIGGITSDDARDVYTGINAIRAQLKAQGLSFSRTDLVGYSMGALNAAFVVQYGRDSETPFHRAVLINPPVCMAHGMSVLDSFVDQFQMPRTEIARLAVKATLAILIPIQTRKVLKYSRHSQIKRFLDNRGIWTQKELSALIGRSFQNTVAGGIEVASAMGKFAKDHQVRSFTDYCSHATVPLYQRNYPDATTETLFSNESLLKIGPSLARDGNVHILHNEDDFLLRQTEIVWLKSQFGSTLKLFETGGHLGNVWRPEFHAALEDSLRV